MRQIGTVTSEREAQVFADHLLAQKITTKLLPTKEGGWAIWVQNEDLVPRAAEEFRAFVEAPGDPRYRVSGEVAREVRRAAEKAEKDHRKNTRDLRDRWDGPAWRRYPLTVALIAASVAVGLLTDLGEGPAVYKTPFRALLFSDFSITFEIEDQGIRPREVSHGLREIREGQVWRLVTPIFLHFGPIHLLFNMLWLRSLGGLIETRKGTLRFFVLSLTAAIASDLGQYLLQSSGSETVIFGGMSGVVYALFGYLWMKGQAHPEEGLSIHANTVIMMLAWFLICMTGRLGPIANGAHGVGLVVGMFFGLTRF